MSQILVLFFCRTNLICPFIFHQNLKDTNQYVQNEMDALEREQQQIDRRAAMLETQLRKVMEKGWYSPTCIKQAP